ncbi:MAG: dihydroorotate dehydrogenase [Verrucomicrobiales bacterium]|nr:dihydroorotate dehydrogenase [Verrucomicrobiales bacterium]|tara:strand:+ start:12915 stop:13970 length:1056 start_codon:yes stop_codon:yes gene_type:complete
MVQTYDIKQSYRSNYEIGPQFVDPPPEVPDTPTKNFLGMPVRSRLGIAAGMLLNSKWIEGYAKHGFDILTYKTVRSAHRECYPLPNWVFVNEDGRVDGPVFAVDDPGDDPTAISSAVCFGMPSMDPSVWREDIGRAKAALAEGQVLIVSVVATPGENASRDEVVEDFVQCARWAHEAGADVVEANFSCPNVCTAEGTIYQDTEFSCLIAREMRDTLGDARFLLKVGYFGTDEHLRNFLRELNGLVNGITLVNGISRPVLRPDGQPVFGPDYEFAGVLGRAIHNPSVENVCVARNIVDSESLDLELVAVGGVSQTSDARDFFDAGASAVMMGSSPMYLPGLAADAKRAHPEW